jgi:hypothetical protein
MLSNKLAFTALGAACVFAAGAGGYLALRQNAIPAPLRASQTSSTSASAAASDRPVQETEAIVEHAPAPKPAATAAPIRTPAAAARREVKPAPVQTARAEVPSSAERPSSAAASSAPAPSPAPQTETAPSARPLETVERVAPEPALLPEPPQKSYEELVVSSDSVIGLQSETTVSSDRARVEDRVEARVTRDVRVGGRVAIPAGARAIGIVSQVDRGGKFKERARIAIRFQTVVLADGTRLPISTDAVIREGAAPGEDTAKKIGGGAVAGTILGAILGGGKGAAIGGIAGAGVGTGVVAAGQPNVATLRAGEPITIRLLSPVTVVTER